MVWQRFLDGKEADHTTVTEGKVGGTTEDDMVAREKKRADMKRMRHLHDDEL